MKNLRSVKNLWGSCRFTQLFLYLCFFLWASQAMASVDLTSISGKQVITGEESTISVGQKKGLVVVFLSAVCPCSNSHVVELGRLQREFKAFEFVGVHSNVDEPREKTLEYFKKVDLPFPVVQDQKAQIANSFKAYKTPHAFIISKTGEKLFQGGVSSSSDFSSADKNYLREALEDIDQGKKVRTPMVRTLGCAISRG